MITVSLTSVFHRPQKYELRSLLAALIAIVLLGSVDSTAQRIPCRVRFTDKGPAAFVPGTALYDSVLATFHPLAIARRTQMGKDPVLDVADAPLYNPYRSAVVAISDSVLAEVVWFNMMIVGLSTAEQSQVRLLPFVVEVSPCSTVSYGLWDGIFCDPPRYREALSQVQLAGVLPLHDGGVYGRDVRIALIDNGFRWRTMTSLQHLQVEGEADIINNDTNTALRPGDPWNQDGHGSGILSIIAGWRHDSLIGIAPFSKYLLAKSEDMRYERRIEEDLFVASVTWAEKNGAQIASASVGYRYFDSTDAETPWALMDGKTAYASRAVNRASELGVLFVVAAGNNGPDSMSLNVPADADSAIVVGSILMDSRLWPFSSRGPTADGRLKPDLVAMGTGTVSQNVDNAYIRSAGTSNAAPIVAGQLALLRELYPELPPWQIRDALYNAGTNAGSKDSSVGYGPANATEAARTLGPGIAPPSVVYIDGIRSILVAIYNTNPTQVSCIVRTGTGNQRVVEGTTADGTWYQFPVPKDEFEGGSVEARIVAQLNSAPGQRSYPRDSSWFPIPENETTKPCGVRYPSSITSVANQDANSGLRDLVVADHPVPRGTKSITIHNMSGLPRSVRCYLLVSGENIPATLSVAQRGTVGVQFHTPLTTGLYLIAFTLAGETRTLPFVVE